VNKVVDFDPSQSEKKSKRMQLQRLMGLLGDVSTPSRDKSIVRSPKNETDDLVKSSRSLDDVQRIINKIISED
jgi:hypothetical protein